jgi:hypothetical protein
MTKSRTVAAALGAAAIALAAAGALATASPSPATAAPVPEVFSGFRDTSFLSGSTPMTLNLNVPAGSYMLTAKVSGANNGTPSASHVVHCDLRAGTDLDRSFSRIRSGDEQVLSNSLVHTFTSAGTVQYICTDTATGNLTTMLQFAKVTALRVNAPISNIQL